MKRIYIAILFLAISIGLCIFEQYTVKSAYETTTEYINTAIEQTDKEDFSSAGETCKQLREYWDKKYPYMTAMIEHGILDDAGITINSLENLAENESDDLQEELITAKNQMESIRDNQRITFGNIF